MTQRLKHPKIYFSSLGGESYMTKDKFENSTSVFDNNLTYQKFSKTM